MTVKRAGIIGIWIVILSFPVFSIEADPFRKAAVSPQETTEGESGIPPEFPASIGFESVFLALGFEYGNFWGRYFDGAQNVQTYRTSPAINLFTYFIRDERRVGFFIHNFQWGFPNISALDGVQPEYSGYSGRQVGIMSGPLLRHVLDKKFALFYGAGLSFLQTREDYTQYVSGQEETFSRLAYSLGIGANIMLRYILSARFSLFAGAILTCDFLGFDTVRSSNSAFNASGRVQDFFMFGLRPYVSIGFKPLYALPAKRGEYESPADP